MEKMFYEVFGKLELIGKIKEIFQNVVVTKVSSNARRDIIKVYIESQCIIQRREIMVVEREIKKQLFANVPLNVVIVEKFKLDDTVTAKQLLEKYYDSIILELKENDIVLYNMFKTSVYEFTDDYHLHIKFNDTLVMREKFLELKDYLFNIFEKRCGINLAIEEEFVENLTESLVEESEEKIWKEIENIVSQNALKSEELQKEEAYAKEQEAKKAEAKKNYYKKSVTFRHNPNVFFGRDFEGDITKLEEIVDEIGEVVVRGKVVEVETRKISDEKTIISFTITDFTDSIVGKIFVKNEKVDEILGILKKGAYISLKGVAANDTFLHEVSLSSIVGIKKIDDFTTKRMDNAQKKRVELHCHTKMSDMDGISEVSDIINRAMEWGHQALAITDHGVVQAFPDANHTASKDFKVIYGVEGYLVDDLKDIIVNAKGQSLDEKYVVFDLETTGLSSVNDKIIEIGAVKVEKGKIVDSFSTFVNPLVPISYRIQELTGINDSMVADAPVIEKVLPEFMEFCKDCVLVAHNAEFDVGFIEINCKKMGIATDFTVADTIALARILVPEIARYKLDTLAKHLGIPLVNHHRAVDDARCTAEIFVKFIEMLKNRGFENLDDLNKEGVMDIQAVKKLRSYHIIILAKNDIGRVNLYKLVSYSHIDCFYKKPLIPKSVLQKHREGLIIGSACEAGELFQAILDNKSEEEIERIVNFYDYLEVQPIGNNRFMIDNPKIWVSSEQDLIDLNKKIIDLGDAFQKPVVATCDVHFLNPEDEVYRRIIMTGNGFSDADNQAPLYLRTTEEMLAEFSYLDRDKAQEIVVDNTIKIADMCERISPVRPDKCPPVIEDSDKTLEEICYNRAHEIYGDELPPVVEARLKKELNSIITNGFAVMYIIAQKLVWKSNEDGYLVGSRGSVGSSFVATMAGITKVNPLSPHYYCSKCHYSDFDSDEVKEYAGRAGCDMPDKKCPVCGEILKKDGFDIPFETFLGFKGDKEPDIDLNFSGDYQAKAHKYTEVIFGKGQTFKAGTIGTVAEKTAIGYVLNYFRDKEITKRNCEINRLAKGCVGIRRTTGQHPGGIVVLPHGEDICSFTPIQHPANDTTSDIITTHFDYHSIDHNLLKLDILGHDDPTMIKMLEDLTGIDAKSIPLDDKTVMSLFSSTKALGIEPEDIGGCKLGALGIPEFGTDFVIQMLIDTKPQSFSDLVRISGLSHGTDVWLNNAQTLIQQGKATISTAICTRDDIMTYLINKGVDSEESFKIMENVRKGKVAGGKCDKWPEWKEDMLAHDVPDWYVESCEKIKYMFPKAHAAAYVMMAWRIAYFKVFYPLAYYTAYFSIRASGFTYELMCQGKECLEYHLNDFKKRGDKLSNREKDILKDMRIVQEMYARGFEFMKIDLYRAKARDFQIIEGKIMPALSSIEGLGEKAAYALEEEAGKGPFLSKDDLRQRAKISKTVVDLLEELGILDDLPESNQLSLFDF